MAKILTIPVRNRFTPVRRTIHKDPKCGVECMFIHLTKSVGVKIFTNKGRAERSCKRQRKAYRLGFAPKVLSRVKKCYTNNLHHLDHNDVLCGEVFCHCYMTQVVETRRNYSDNAIEKLEKKVRRARMSSGDLHNGNIGVIDGELVMIDFGDVSMER